MDRSLSDEQQQIADSATTFLQEASAMPAVRAASESASGLDTELWRGMAELLATHSDPQAREVRLYSVTVSEKGAQSATYMEVAD